MKRYGMAGLGLVLLVLTGGCKITLGSNQLNPSLLSQSYTLSYSEQSSLLCGTAQYTAGNAQVILNSPAEVTFDGQTMNVQNPGPGYSECLSQGYGGTHTWVFTDQNRNEFSNSASLNPLTLSSVPSVVSRSAGVAISFNPALVTNEQMQVTVTGPTSSGLKTVTIPATLQGSEIVLNSGTFSPFENGTAMVSFQRILTKMVSQPLGANPASVTTEYQSRAFSISLTN